MPRHRGPHAPFHGFGLQTLPTVSFVSQYVPVGHSALTVQLFRQLPASPLGVAVKALEPSLKVLGTSGEQENPVAQVPARPTTHAFVHTPDCPVRPRQLQVVVVPAVQVDPTASVYVR